MNVTRSVDLAERWDVDHVVLSDTQDSCVGANQFAGQSSLIHCSRFSVTLNSVIQIYGVSSNIVTILTTQMLVLKLANARCCLGIL